jgi:hypothetical protein
VHFAARVVEPRQRSPLSATDVELWCVSVLKAPMDQLTDRFANSSGPPVHLNLFSSLIPYGRSEDKSQRNTLADSDCCNLRLKRRACRFHNRIML